MHFDLHINNFAVRTEKFNGTMDVSANRCGDANSISRHSPQIQCSGFRAVGVAKSMDTSTCRLVQKITVSSRVSIIQSHHHDFFDTMQTLAWNIATLLKW
tara:strand:- start:259 stop:558 length:300 start_codon:yes stop_codon:yes gene_type:complete